jgi:hypothetical protein
MASAPPPSPADREPIAASVPESAPDSAPRAGLRVLLADRTFAFYTAGQFCTQIGFWTMQIATGWLAWQLTGSETWLGTIAFMQFAPTAFLGLYAGAVADRYNRLAIVISMQAAAFALLCALFLLGVTGGLTIGWLAVLVLGIGTAQTFALPAMRALVSQLVPRKHLPKAISLNSITMNMARFTGPSIAGALIWLGHLEYAFLVSAVLSAFFLAVLIRIARSGVLAESPARARGKLNAMVLEGLNAARTNRDVAALFVIYAIYSFFARPFIDLLPAIVSTLLGGGAPTLAALTIIFALVAIVLGLLLAGIGNSQLLWRTLVPSCLVMGAGIAIVVLFGSPALAFLGVALYGIGQVTINISTLTLSQLLVDDGMRGRISGTHFLIFRTGAAFGSLGMGALAERVGLMETFLVAALIVGGVGGLLALRAGRNAVARPSSGRPTP